MVAAQDWALGGMDATAYHDDGRAIPGHADVVTQWHGKTWHFASEENRAEFEADPTAYAPAFDGLCAMSLSEGRIERGNPHYFVIYKDKLYLLRSEAARAQFIAGPAEVLALAKGNYKKMRR